MTKFSVDIRTLIDLGLGFEAYFVLYCLYKGDQELLFTYVRKCKKINTGIFEDLEIKGYLSIDYGEDKTLISFNMLSITDKGKALFSSHLTLAQATEEFELFKINYPSVVKVGSRVVRRPQTNKGVCIKLYKDIREEGISFDDLCRCARIYVKEKTESGSQQYISMLETWLRQRVFDEYINEVEVQGRTGDFMDDI